MRALVVDDNPGNRRLMAAMLQALDIDVQCVPDGADAVVLAHARDFDLVLMDKSMPGMDGLTAIRRIRAAETEYRRPPLSIFVVSSEAQPRDRRAARRAGADGHISKPICVARFLSAIHSARARFVARHRSNEAGFEMALPEGAVA